MKTLNGLIRKDDGRTFTEYFTDLRWYWKVYYVIGLWSIVYLVFAVATGWHQ